MQFLIKWSRKIVVFIFGVIIIVIGIIFIPLPGPGLLICLVGLTFLATEFEWAKKYTVKLRAYIKRMYKHVKTSRNKPNDVDV